MQKPCDREPNTGSENNKWGGVEKQLIREFYIVLSLDKIEECIDHPKQNDRESHHQEHAVEVVPPDLGLDADVGH